MISFFCATLLLGVARVAGKELNKAEYPPGGHIIVESVEIACISCKERGILGSVGLLDDFAGIAGHPIEMMGLLLFGELKEGSIFTHGQLLNWVGRRRQNFVHNFHQKYCGTNRIKQSQVTDRR